MKFMKHACVLLAASCMVTPALAEMVVIVNAKAAASAMSKDEVAQFYLGKSTSMTPIDQPESAPQRAEFYKKVAGKELAQAKALWAKLIFTGKASAPVEAAGSAEVKKMVAADPKAIGYVDKSAVDGSVKVVLTVQ